MQRCFLLERLRDRAKRLGKSELSKNPQTKMKPTSAVSRQYQRSLLLESTKGRADLYHSDRTFSCNLNVSYLKIGNSTSELEGRASIADK